MHCAQRRQNIAMSSCAATMSVVISEIPIGGILSTPIKLQNLIDVLVYGIKTGNR